ncbi:conserved exported protein of unknown function [Candidatus Filomicrobium marinum]|uniref:Tripartite tricarboxylate transporter substrate binding protein n=1 Tax=Candidatus Filomicrobium marinum TaxID=1608628 RepID=A0A0D6JJN9_9HYPH|nr:MULTISPECIES: tripartite tricarboxylate transporter substrate-binding protein [Filomicrobium]MCV0371580.1 tripartite tricarboxylate transporter substrate binding protein [Filomicrobium sp.]CFX54587.1 conserved exported protein of unknown function [Candidatus Filomicrobium marinum]CPR22151.1 conserved exported protein of unknown function [Candidatus Filomicrobium marinum]
MLRLHLRQLRIGVAFILAALLSTCVTAAAQWQPNKPVTFIVMAGRDGGADKATRFIVDLIERNQLTKAKFEVVNIPGNSGADALQELQRRAGDDHIILFTLNSFYTTPIDKPELKIDIGAFAPIARLAEDVFLLWVHTDRKDINTIEDFVREARTKGKDWVMSGTGTGAEDHLLTEFLNATFGLDMSYRALKGGGAVAKELTEKLCDSTVNNPSEQRKYYEAGITKPIVAITPARITQFQSTPTLRETGMDFNYFMQRSVVGPPSMTKAAQAYYADLFKRVFTSADWQNYRKKNSLSGEWLSGPDLAAYWLKEREKHARWKMTIEVLRPAP